MSKYRKIAALTLVLLFPGILIAQDSYCVRSWKNGKTSVDSQSLVITLDKSNSSYTKIIKDSTGVAKYELLIMPGTVGKSKEIIEWMVGLEEIGARDSVDLLKPTNDPGQDAFSAEDYPGWFYLGEGEGQTLSNAFLPFLTKRVIRIENFYLTMRVTKYKRNRTTANVIDSATFEITFVNLGNGSQISRECEKKLERHACDPAVLVTEFIK